LPAGVVIPWFNAAQLWRVNVRRLSSEPKYVQVAGGANVLYNTDRLSTGLPALIVEGEFDALTVEQCARDIVAAVATGSTCGARREAFAQQLAGCPAVLVSFDADEAGDKAAQSWVSELRNGRRWRPEAHDPNDMLVRSFDVRAWVLAGLAWARPSITGARSLVTAGPGCDGRAPQAEGARPRDSQ